MIKPSELLRSREVCLNLPDEVLERAGNKIGINPLFGYPDAAMAIYENEVKVSVDGGHTWKQIYFLL